VPRSRFGEHHSIKPGLTASLLELIDHSACLHCQTFSLTPLLFSFQIITMFGSNNKDTKNNAPPGAAKPGGGGVNTIDAHTSIQGDLQAGGDIRIDGKLTGNLNCEGKLIIGPQGQIDGDVTCVNAAIEGGFKGNLIVKDMLTLQATAKVEGDIRANKMAILAGCQISGTCTIPYSGNNGSQKSGNPLKNKESATV
jgi:cytoskeletal protein CcmA (bactofilin family)